MGHENDDDDDDSAEATLPSLPRAAAASRGRPSDDVLAHVLEATERNPVPPSSGRDPFGGEPTVRTENPFVGASGRLILSDIDELGSSDLPTVESDGPVFQPLDRESTPAAGTEERISSVLVDHGGGGSANDTGPVNVFAVGPSAATTRPRASSSPVPELSQSGAVSGADTGRQFSGLIRPWADGEEAAPATDASGGPITDITAELGDALAAAKRAVPRPLPGEAVDFSLGGYHVHRRLGQGGMAVVFLARPEGGREDVVLKRIRPSLVREERYVKLFRREASIAAMLDHEHCVRILDHAEEEGEYYIVMEFLDGLDLRDIADRTWSRGQPVPLEPMLRAVVHCARGLHYAHHLKDHKGAPARLVHRDVSPENLFVTRSGSTKVLDFGIAKGNQHVEKLTRTGEVKGKVPYLAPEQILGQSLDGRCDLFALSVTAYWLLTGRRPFDGNNNFMTIKRILEHDPDPLTLLNPFVPESVNAAILKGLAKDPEDRQASCGVFADELEALLDVLPQQVDDVRPILETARGIPRPHMEPATVSPAARPLATWVE